MGLHYPQVDRVISGSAEDAAALLVKVISIILGVTVLLAVSALLALALLSILMPIAQYGCNVAFFASSNAPHPAVPPLMHAACLQDLRLNEQAITVVVTLIFSAIIFLGTWLLKQNLPLKRHRGH